jgi:drug/metabolite transporter (DMT)-like permease
VPLWIAILDRIFFGQRLPKVVVIGLVVGFAGVAMLLSPGGAHTDPRALALVGSSIAWAVGSLYARGAAMPARPLVSASMQMLTGGVMLAVISAVAGEHVDVAAISTESWLGLLYLIVAGSFMGYTAYVWLLRVAPISLVGTYAYVNPVVAVLLGTLILGEPLGWKTIVGGAVILGAVALIVRAPRSKAEPRTRPAALPARAR